MNLPNHTITASRNPYLVAAIIDVLTDIDNGNLSRPNNGICDNLDRGLRLRYCMSEYPRNLLDGLTITACKNLNFYSGSVCYPIIPSDMEELEKLYCSKYPSSGLVLSSLTNVQLADMAYTYLPKWAGSYGNQRKSLVKEIINLLKEAE